uniref:Uncharacterized protein n=1 Tax=Photinus pyralis TaxID=7054 RepID=A0A1Y1MTQ7_PHOPY
MDVSVGDDTIDVLSRLVDGDDTVASTLVELPRLEVVAASFIVVILVVGTDAAGVWVLVLEPELSGLEAEVEVGKRLEDVPYLYSSSLKPAPQYSVLSPEQRKLQSS